MRTKHLVPRAHWQEFGSVTVHVAQSRSAEEQAAAGDVEMTDAPNAKSKKGKKAPKKKKTKPAKPEYKPEDLDKDLDSYMAAAPANPEAMAA